MADDKRYPSAVSRNLVRALRKVADEAGEHAGDEFAYAIADVTANIFRALADELEASGTEEDCGVSIVITNVSDHDDFEGVNEYVVRINHGPVLARFKHIRKDGLAMCLLRAAEAVEAIEAEKFKVVDGPAW